MKFRELRLKKHADCPICSVNPTQRELIDYEFFCGLTPEPQLTDGFEIEVTDLKTLLDTGRPVTVLDVRNPPEYAICRIEGSVLIPLHELRDRLGELDPADTIVAHCHKGMRSAQAVGFLRQMGFARAVNLAGGIDAWSLEVDRSVPRY
jgi:adenylyltransferase/sulfurtransferase